MRVFVDECVPYKMMPNLTGHDFTHISETPWLSTKNGALLRLVQGQYDVFLTTDRHLKDQQNLSRFNLAFVVMRGISKKVEDLIPLVPETLATLHKIGQVSDAAGTLYEITP